MAKTETKMTEADKKAKDAARAKEYRARKKAEADAAATPKAEPVADVTKELTPVVDKPADTGSAPVPVISKSTVVAAVEKAKGAEGPGVLGYLLWCGVSPRAEILRQTFDELVKEKGASDVAPPPALRDRSAFRKALRAAEQQGLVRKITEDATRIVYGLVSEARDTTKEELDYSQEDAVALNKETLELTFKTGNQASKIKAAFSRFLGIYNNIDLQHWVLGAWRRMSAIRVREKGGVYFVLPDQVVTVRRINAVLQAIGPDKGESYVDWVALQSTAVEKQAIGRAAVSFLTQQLEEAAGKLGENLTDTSARTNTFKNRLEDFKGIREQAKLLRDHLTFQTEDLEKALAAAEKAAKDRLES